VIHTPLGPSVLVRLWYGFGMALVWLQDLTGT
jgi:hypothetical protein